MVIFLSICLPYKNMLLVVMPFCVACLPESNISHNIISNNYLYLWRSLVLEELATFSRTLTHDWQICLLYQPGIEFSFRVE
jgi:hypothetical protein